MITCMISIPLNLLIPLIPFFRCAKHEDAKKDNTQQRIVDHKKQMKRNRSTRSNIQ